MGKLVGSECFEIRPFEPDFPDKRNPWDQGKHPEQFAYIQSIISRIDKEDIRQPKYTEATRLEVYRLRDEGYTLREIADTVKVSKSTACLYLQNREKYLAKAHGTSKPKMATAKITQPGTDTVVDAVVAINEITVGKVNIASKGDA